jgi:hypothetical protein
MTNILNDEYSFDKKKKMASKISDMRDKNVLRKIRDIIFTENPHLNAKKSNNGYLMYFQNYTNETYYKIEKLLNKVENDNLEKQTKTITESTEQLLLSSENDDKNVDYISTRSRLRYSNRERRLIARKQYENIINEQNENKQHNIFEKTLIPTSQEPEKSNNKKIINKIVISTNNPTLITTADTIVLKKTNHENTTKKINSEVLCNNFD